MGVHLRQSQPKFTLTQGSLTFYHLHTDMFIGFESLQAHTYTYTKTCRTCRFHMYAPGIPVLFIMVSSLAASLVLRNIPTLHKLSFGACLSLHCFRLHRYRQVNVVTIAMEIHSHGRTPDFSFSSFCEGTPIELKYIES